MEVLEHSIEMVDLKGQHLRLKDEIEGAIRTVIDSGRFIRGNEVSEFERSLSMYLRCPHTISCANGTDALQIALMALELQDGDEVIVPSFNYISAAEVILLLGLKPVFVDVDPCTFTISTDAVKAACTDRTKAIIAVHLFGQCAPMEELLSLARAGGYYLIEDNAQSLGVDYHFKDGTSKKAGTIADIGCTSFFPTKMLGCLGDGGALFTADGRLAERMRMISSHGQKERYMHEVLGVNSRLDTIQAAVLNVKLNYLDDFIQARKQAAFLYHDYLSDLSWMQVPCRSAQSDHVFNQYTLILNKGVDREDFQTYLHANGVPSMIYYPLPLHLQKVFCAYGYRQGDFPVSEALCRQVISLPMHTELSEEDISFITTVIRSYQA